MPRYELVEGTSSKFWEIERGRGDRYTVTWGRIGTAGQSQIKKLDEAQFSRLVHEKTKKGYVVVGGAPTKGKPTTKAKPTAKPAVSNAKLEETLYEAIDDRERWLVYADWLQQQSDVRGEIIALSLANKKAAAAKLATANADALWGEAAFLREREPFAKLTYTPRWKGAMPTPLPVGFRYTLGREGMIEAITLSGLDEAGHTAKAMFTLLSAPIGRFVRSIEIEGANEELYSGSSGMPNGDAVIGAIARAKPTALRSLAMSTGGYQRSYTSTGDLGPLWKVTPYLERVALSMGTIHLGKQIDLPRLQSLSIVTGGLDRKNLTVIGNAKWPALTSLTLYLGHPDYGGSAKRADVAALLASPAHFPKLTTLAICNAAIQGDVVQVVARSPLLKQLAALDLSKGTLVDAEAAPIVANLAAFKKLRSLDLSENYLSPELERTLRKALGKVFITGGSRYEEMVEERGRLANNAWAKKHTFRYTVIGE